MDARAARSLLSSLGDLRRSNLTGNETNDSKSRVKSVRCQVPRVPEGATHLGGPSFYEHREVSFVGRPCPLERLEEHLNRPLGRSSGLHWLWVEALAPPYLPDSLKKRDPTKGWGTRESQVISPTTTPGTESPFEPSLIQLPQASP